MVGAEAVALGISRRRRAAGFGYAAALWHDPGRKFPRDQRLDVPGAQLVLPGLYLLVCAGHGCLPGFKEWIQRIRWVLLGGAILLFAGGIVEWELLLRGSGQQWVGTRETLLDNVYIFLFLMAYLAFEKFPLPRAALVSQLGARSYGIYLVHLLVMEITARTIYHFLPGVMGAMGVFMPILVAMGLGVPVAMMEIMNRLPVRRYYEYVFG
jgi:peptidoglycan/LPS O-acetylase OafA/YrhL